MRCLPPVSSSQVALADVISSSRDLSPQHRLMTYYGYSFESYCTKDNPRNDTKFQPPPGPPPGWGSDVNTNVQYCHIVKTKLGQSHSQSHRLEMILNSMEGEARLIMGGEVDCAKGKIPSVFAALRCC